jgi:hypothetical protein
MVYGTRDGVWASLPTLHYSGSLGGRGFQETRVAARMEIPNLQCNIVRNPFEGESSGSRDFDR